jgi:hypothetical protein
MLITDHNVRDTLTICDGRTSSPTAHPRGGPPAKDRRKPAGPAGVLGRALQARGRAGGPPRAPRRPARTPASVRG